MFSFLYLFLCPVEIIFSFAKIVTCFLLSNYEQFYSITYIRSSHKLYSLRILIVSQWVLPTISSLSRFMLFNIFYSRGSLKSFSYQLCFYSFHSGTDLLDLYELRDLQILTNYLENSPTSLTGIMVIICASWWEGGGTKDVLAQFYYLIFFMCQLGCSDENCRS